MVRIKSTLAGLFCIGLMLAGCNGGDGATAVAEGDLIGKWILTSFQSKGYMKLTIFGTPQTIPLDTTETYTDNANYYDFKADHTFTANTPEPDMGAGLGLEKAAAGLESGTWSLSGNTLTTISTESGSTESDTMDIKVSLSGADGTFSYHVDEKDSTFEIKFDAVAKAKKSSGG